MKEKSRSTRLGALRSLALAFVAVALCAPVAVAAPATQTWVGQAAGATPDLERAGLTIYDRDGNQTRIGNVAGTINIAIDGVPRLAFCIDTSRSFRTGPLDVELTRFDPPPTADDRALVWIILNRAPTGASSPQKVAQAAAAQAAVWILRGQASPTAPTDDPSLNAATLALLAEARAATLAPATIGVSVIAPAAGATSAAVTVSGRPGATVALAIASGQATLGATSLTIGSGGSATTSVSVSGPGAVSVSASTAGDGRLFTVNPTDPELRSQPTAYAEPTQIAATATVAFTASSSPVAVVPISQAPTVPRVPVAGAPAPTLRIAKSAPPRARVLSKVSYRITIRNPGATAARNVILRDRLPARLSFVSSSRPGVLRNGTITFAIGTLRGGESRTVTVVLMADASVRGSLTNVATVSATRVKGLRASARTLFQPLARRVQPAVTG